MNILFVCNQNKNRSKTAAEIFKGRFNTRSAGLYSQHKLSARDLAWSDVVMVMEDEQRSEIAKRFPRQYLQKRILSLNIPDVYGYNHPKLIQELNSKVKEYADLLI